MDKIIVTFILLQSMHNLCQDVNAISYLEVFDPSLEEAQLIGFNSSSDIFQKNASKDSNITDHLSNEVIPKEGHVKDIKGSGGVRHYVVHASALPWLEAELACWKAGAHLAAPRNRHEALELGRLLVNSAASIVDTEMRDALHVGVHDIARQGAWRNIDGRLLSEAGYDLWLEGGSGSCGALLADGRYIRTDCSVELAYACESSRHEGAWETTGYKEVNGAGLFRLYEDPLPWALALHHCEAEGATLAVPASAREAGLLAGVLVTRAAAHERLREHGFFVGITDVAREGDWRSSSGQLLEDTGYNTWAPHQPSGRRSQNCGKLTADGRYADSACMAPLAYCCKLDMPKALRGESSTHGSFRLHAAELPWFDALRACQRQNATLAVPGPAQEQELAALLVSARETNVITETRVYVGVHDIAETGTWKTLWGEVVLGDDPGLSFYGYGKLNRKRIKLLGSVSDSCAYMNTLGEYGNIHCSARLPFICQMAS